MGGGDLHVLPLCMMGRGIPAPTPSDTKRDVGALPPIPSIHHRVTDRSKSGRQAHVHQWAAHDLPRRIKCDGGGWSAAHKCAWRTAPCPLKPPHGRHVVAERGPRGRFIPSGPRGGLGPPCAPHRKSFPSP
uniref:Uncharacterized protein n=1 Tax=Oryza sativa subsp. japonica TaxID=39947 RepID=Q69P45_ORYSJ|nr:hypothetical protein [Oryza sativa Japonica Group]BAD33651.1 hypothetical protein [Oryza sativa Japonica Group]